MTPIHDDYAFNSMAYYVDENGILEMNHNWEYIYGSLDKGIYRLVKNVFLNLIYQLVQKMNIIFG